MPTLEEINEDVKIRVDNTDSTKLDENERREFEKVKSIISTLNSVVKWKSYSYIHRYLTRYKPKPMLFKDYSKLINDNQLLSIDICLKHLKISNNTFYEGLNDSPINLLTYIRTKTETMIESKYNSILDLESPEKIGVYGQRLPDLFDAIIKRFPSPEDRLAKPIVNLLKNKDDIVKIVHNSTELANIYQSLNDITFHILVNIESSILKDLDELNKYKKEIQDLKEKIEEKKKEINRLNDEILENRRELNKPVEEEEKLEEIIVPVNKDLNRSEPKEEPEEVEEEQEEVEEE